MSSTLSNGESEITLQLLTAVHENSAVTQRTISRDLGIALGLANAYLKRCVKKGLIKVRQVPRNRYAYYLTPKGFAEKSRMTAEYLSQSFSLFRQARAQYSDLLSSCAARGWTRVAFCGAGDLAEIAGLYAPSVKIEVVGVVDRLAADGAVGPLRVFRDVAELGAVDAILVTDLRDPQAAYELAAKRLPAERVLAPKLLGLAANPARATGAPGA